MKSAILILIFILVVGIISGVILYNTKTINDITSNVVTTENIASVEKNLKEEINKEDEKNVVEGAGGTVSEGEEYTIPPGEPFVNMCKPGLKAIAAAKYSKGLGCMYPACSCFVCTKCGNGTCEENENSCNCSEDCEENVNEEDFEPSIVFHSNEVESLQNTQENLPELNNALQKNGQRKYFNSEYGFEISYPFGSHYAIEDHVVEEKGSMKSESTTFADSQSRVIYILDKENLDLFHCCDPVNIRIEVLNEKVQDLKGWIYDNNIINDNNIYRVESEKYGAFEGNEAYFVRAACGVDSSNNIILVNHDQRTYYINYPAKSCMESSEDIVSTFKFR